MVAKGMSYKQIAERLVLSHRTVQNHVQNTLRKLQMHNRVELTRYAIEQGLDDDRWSRRAGGERRTLLAEADALYGVALPEFTPARDARARELKGSDPELSRSGSRPCASPRPPPGWSTCSCVARPSRSGRCWPSGPRCGRRRPSLAGDELRALTRQRRQLTAAVTGRARAVAAEHGLRVTGGGLRPGRGHAHRRDPRRGLRPGGAQRAAGRRPQRAPASTRSTSGAAIAVPEALGLDRQPPRGRAHRRGPSCTSYPTPTRTGRHATRPVPGSRRRRQELTSAREALAVGRCRRRGARGAGAPGPGRDRRAAPAAGRARGARRGGRRGAGGGRGRAHRGRGRRSRRRSGAGTRPWRPRQGWREGIDGMGVGPRSLMVCRRLVGVNVVHARCAARAPR